MFRINCFFAANGRAKGAKRDEGVAKATPRSDERLAAEKIGVLAEKRFSNIL